MDLDLPFKIEYARQGSSIKCKRCRKTIAQDKLQIAEMVQSQRHDGKDPVWFHKECFLSSHRVHSRDEFANFEGIKYDDQLDILMKIDKNSNFEQIALKRANEKPLKSSDINNFGVEYSTSNDDKCWVCKEQIMRTELRFKKTVYNSEIAMEFGKEILWNHLHCFIEKREILDFIHGGDRLPGYAQLKTEHRRIIRDVLPPLIQDEDDDDSDIQIIKEELKPQLDKQPKAIETLEEKIANQTAELMRVRQALQKVCTPEELQFFLVANDSDVIEDFDSMLDRCADILTFGAFYKCQKCYQGDMIFTKYHYTCNGMIDEWVKCGNSENMPLRLKCLIPKEFKHKSFFATCEPRVEHRAFRPLIASPAQRPIAGQMPGPSGLKKVENLKLRNGTAVDPKSMLDHAAHVYRTKEILYSSVLGLTDIERNKNSYYKLQVLESDAVGPLGTPNYWLFTSWGRIGTDIGDKLVEPVNSADKACAMFKKAYEKQTGNEWNSGGTFKKQMGKFYPIDVNYSDDIETNTSIASLLSPQVEELMKLLFNIQNMKTAMKEFKLDLEKMPLGKLSVKQLQAAYLALGELEGAINHDRPKQDLVGLSNKFYTFVPHNFGLAKAPVIDTLDGVNAKREMIDSLLDIEHAYALMVQAGNGEINSFDGYYKKLGADIQPLDRNSMEFRQIETYTRNTTVHQFKIQILEVFKVSRHEERQRFQPFQHFNNRMLLWHGSRTTNFASIISNGLKVSTQVNGSMFGRGIYFADMVSKSARYCQAQGMPEALMVLSEVALGNMHELKNAAAIVAPPAGLHSVKGVGQTVPDPSKSVTRQDGVVIPLGAPVNANNNANRFRGVLGTGGGLLYNEYIVYNEAQVKIQYLVKMKIN